MRSENSTLTISNATINGDGNTITGDDNTIKGDYNTIIGKDNTIIGDYNNVNGDGNNIDGDFNNVSGNKNYVNGDYNNAFGTQNNMKGDYNNNSGIAEIKSTNSKPLSSRSIINFGFGNSTETITKKTFGPNSVTIVSKRPNSFTITQVSNRRKSNNVIAGEGTIIANISNAQFGNNSRQTNNFFSDTIPSQAKRRGDIHSLSGSISTKKMKLNDDDTASKEKVAALKQKIEKELKSENPSPDEKYECKICFTNQKRVVWVPCSHMTCCLSCSLKILNQDSAICPECQQQIIDVVIPYI